MEVGSQRIVEELLECSICMNLFETSGLRIPKMLPCQHTFCLDCIKNIKDFFSVECPACRKVFRGSIEDLPNNFVLLQLIDHQSNNRKCENCQLQRKDVKSRCESCFDEIVERELAKSIALTKKYEKAQGDSSTVRRRHIQSAPDNPPDEEKRSTERNQVNATSAPQLQFPRILLFLNIAMLVFLFCYHCEVVIISIVKIITYLKNHGFPLLCDNVVKILLVLSQILRSIFYWLRYLLVTFAPYIGVAILMLFEYTIVIMKLIWSAVVFCIRALSDISTT